MSASAAGGGRVTLRAIAGADESFLERVYASTREAEMQMLPWDDEQKQAFVRSQHSAQQAHHRASHPDADYQLILLDGVPAGRLYVARGDRTIHLIDIALLPEHRGRGIGGALLGELTGEADARGLPLTAHVERHNRALGLYRRLGFREVADSGVYLSIERPPAG